MTDGWSTVSWAQARWAGVADLQTYLTLAVVDRFEQVTRPVGRRIEISRAEPQTAHVAQRIDE